MLAIRLKRTGRAGHAQFRVVVQDSHFHPTRGRIVAYLGSYDPHSKVAQIDKELAEKYLGTGAQPSDRVAKLLQSGGIKLPDWVKINDPRERAIRNPEKLRRNRPAGEAAAAEAEAPAAEGSDEPVPESPAEAEVAAPQAPVETEPAPADTEAPAATEAEDTSTQEPQAEPDAPETPAEAPAEQ